MKKTKLIVRLSWVLLIVFLLMNVVAYFHAYAFSHFSENTNIEKTISPDKLSLNDKIKTLFFGVKNPKPILKESKPENYQTIFLQSNYQIECWYSNYLSVDKSEKIKGAVILFHGYGSEKSSLISRAHMFESWGYDILLVDFMGCGGSQGNTTTIGFMEANQVKASFDYLKNEGHENIILFGSSMGAVAIMKAINDFNLTANGLVLECPFGSMQATVNARFNNMNIPKFPMANLLLFWGGIQLGYNAFKHKPETYAKHINIPTLLLYGAKDKSVSLKETETIFDNLQGSKKLHIFPDAGHENYLVKYKTEWENVVSEFINEI